MSKLLIAAGARIASFVLFPLGMLVLAASLGMTAAVLARKSAPAEPST